MSAQKIDVLAFLDAEIASARGLSADAYYLQQLPKLEAVRAAVAELINALQRVQRRAAPHPDDTDADRKRQLYHCEAIARAALAGATP